MSISTPLRRCYVGGYTMNNKPIVKKFNQTNKNLRDFLIKNHALLIKKGRLVTPEIISGRPGYKKTTKYTITVITDENLALVEKKSSQEAGKSTSHYFIHLDNIPQTT